MTMRSFIGREAAPVKQRQDRQDFKPVSTDNYQTQPRLIGTVPLKDLNLQTIKKQLMEEQAAKFKQTKLDEKMKKIDTL
jgi:hypothetical protein